MSNRAGRVLLVLAGLLCGLTTLATGPASASNALGLDFSSPSPSPSSIAADGYSFVSQYLAGPGHLTAASAADFHSHGISIVANWEYHQNSPTNGYSGGVSDATTALADANAAGFPSDLPIYFSVDFDPTPSQISTLISYFHGVASVLGLSRTGAYGGIHTISALFDNNAISYGWQAYAWSNGQWDSRAQMRQIQQVTVGGVLVDEDEAMTGSYGQWTPGGGGGNFRVGSHSSEVSATPGNGFNVAWRGRDPNYSLWVGNGSGATLPSYGDPWALGVAPGTVPSIATFPDGSWVAAWQGRDPNPYLWIATGYGTTVTASDDEWQLGVAPGTSPSIVALPSGGWEVAWQGLDPNKSLWLASGSGTTITAKDDPYALGVAPGTSPSLAALPSGGFEVAWQGRDPNNSLWLATGNGITITAKDDPYALGVAPGTSPSLDATPNRGFEVAWQGRDPNNSLWLATGNGITIAAKDDPYALGVAPGSSPSLATLPNGNFEVIWKGRDPNQSLWLGTGNGTMLYSKGDPMYLGVG